MNGIIMFGPMALMLYREWSEQNLNFQIRNCRKIMIEKKSDG